MRARRKAHGIVRRIEIEPDYVATKKGPFEFEAAGTVVLQTEELEETMNRAFWAIPASWVMARTFQWVAALDLRGAFVARNRQHRFRASGAYRVSSIRIPVGNRRRERSGGRQPSRSLFSYVDLKARVGRDRPLRRVRVDAALSDPVESIHGACMNFGRPSIAPR